MTGQPKRIAVGGGLLTRAELPRATGLSRGRIHQLAKAGQLPPEAIETYYGDPLWRFHDVERWKEGRNG